MTPDPIETFCHHASRTRLHDISLPARQATRTFLLDSLGVGIAGSVGPLCAAVLDAHAGAGPARVLGRRVALAPASAALANAYQVHNSEFDCVHDAAVVHPMAVLLGAVLAVVDCADGPVPGDEFLAALTAGVDIACRIGAASRSPMRFFRPATAGAFGATAAAARLSGLDEQHMLAAMGITLSQLCGTMQAHTEGSPLLPLQAGFNARNAVVSCQLAARGVTGPRQVLEGAYGYFALFDGEHDREALLRDLGGIWSIVEVSHKPFPSGRATHGVVDACLELMREHGFSARDVSSVEAAVPPLTHRLVGRPPRDDMQSNYARLCGAYVAACALRHGGVGLDDFSDAALGHADTLALARRIRIEADASGDPNVLAPVTVSVRLDDGTQLSRTLDVVYGAPGKPMGREAHLDKFRANCAASASPVAPEQVEQTIAAVDALEQCRDVRGVLELLQPAG